MITFLEYLSDISDEQCEVDLIGEVDTAGIPMHELNLVHVKPHISNIADKHVDVMRVRSYSAQTLFEQLESTSRILRSGILSGESVFKATLQPSGPYKAEPASLASQNHNDDLAVEELLDEVLRSGGSYQLSIPPRRRTAVIPNVSLSLTDSKGEEMSHIGPRNADWRLILLELRRKLS